METGGKKERIDDLMHNGLKLIQHPEDFCFGCDSVELADFVPYSMGGSLCDLGAGNGILSVLLAAKKNFKKVTAVEIQKDSAELCLRNAEINNLRDIITVENIPMQQMVKKYSKGCFDAVVTNPPYLQLDGGRIAVNSAKAIARHEIMVTLKEVIEVAAHLLKFGGKFYLVSQTARLAETFALCSYFKIEPKVLQILTPKPKARPHLFMAACIMNGKKGLKILPERVINAFSA